MFAVDAVQSSASCLTRPLAPRKSCCFRRFHARSRRLHLAHKAAAEASRRASGPEASPDVVRLVVRALQAQPANATVLRAAAALLDPAGAHAHALPSQPSSSSPPPSSPAGVCGAANHAAAVPSSRAGALAELRHSEARTAALLQAVARAQH